MSFQRIKICRDFTYRVRSLGGRVGLTPNILGRLGICVSLNDPSIPNPAQYDEEGQEYSRYTLLGEWDKLFIALVTERIVRDGLDPNKDLNSQFRAHLNRGVLTLCNRVRDLGDIYELMPAEVVKKLDVKREGKNVKS